jgi:hypothetical protein
VEPRASQRLAVFMSAVLLVSACGTVMGPRCGGAASTTTPASPAPSPTATPTPTPTATPTPSPLLNVFSASDEIVPFVPRGTHGIVCGEWAVLATPDRLAYTPDQIRQMSGFSATEVLAGRPLPSSLLRTTPGALTKGNESAFWPGHCFIDMQITNVSSRAIQIPQVGWRLTGQPQPNREQYQLVDLCPVNAALCSFGIGAAPLGCEHYYAGATLQAGPAGSISWSVPKAMKDRLGTECPEISLDPGHSVEISLGADAKEALVYSVEPVLQLTTSSGDMIVAPPDLASTMPFADPSQFSCYSVQGTQFVEKWTGKDALSFRPTGTCI